MGGFECSTHRRRDGLRLDVLASTGHDRMAAGDYALLATAGIASVREGLRWHRIERLPGHYDWSSLLPMLRAARDTRMEVVWDLLHYGWPDGLDIRSAAFVERFARFSQAAAALIQHETEQPPILSVVNEISFMAWAAGTAGIFHPFGKRLGPQIKRQLVRATIAAIAAIREVAPKARFIQIDPLIHVCADPTRPHTRELARRLNAAQYEAWDMVAGRIEPELGGSEAYLDLIGVNYYPHNQWIADGATIDWQSDAGYRPFRELLNDVAQRYRRPMVVAETGTEGKMRAPWLRYVCGEVWAAERAGANILGICLYPVMNHPGWDDDRHCPNGLIDYDRMTMARTLDPELLLELRRQQSVVG
jgi:beta-glucosidase/6-phospho-beta-glucosidase/beta-galactosidase